MLQPHITSLLHFGALRPLGLCNSSSPAPVHPSKTCPQTRQITALDPQTVVSTPQTVVSRSQTVVSDLQTVAFDPQTLVFDPQTLVFDPRKAPPLFLQDLPPNPPNPRRILPALVVFLWKGCFGIYAEPLSGLAKSATSKTAETLCAILPRL
jgi:hypothetical protein